jgi:hypothetical protein
MSETWERAVDLHFHGERFGDGSLDVDVLPELTAYKSIVVEVAEALSWERRPIPDRLPKNFRNCLRLRFRSVLPGSAGVLVERTRPSTQGRLPAGNVDEFDEAIKLIDDALAAAGADQRLPDAFPKAALPSFGGWGKTLHAGEWIEVCRPGLSLGARFDHDQRARMLAFIDATYEDFADHVGYVLSTSVRNKRFELYDRLDSTQAIEVPLPEQFERLILDVARDREPVQIWVKGRGAFDAHGRLLRFLDVTSIAVFSADESGDVDNTTLWRAMEAISNGGPRTPTGSSLRGRGAR